MSFLILIFHILECRIGLMELRPQDIVVVLKLVAIIREPWTYAQLGEQLSLSPSQVFRSIDRAEVARLLEIPPVPPPPHLATQEHVRSFWPNRGNLKEFLVHGIKYAFPVQRGGLVRGMPTAHAARPLNQQFGDSFEPAPVWPYVNGSVRGTEFSPLYKNVPAAASRDSKLYELLALVDAIRDGRARERDIAIRELTSRIDAK